MQDSDSNAEDEVFARVAWRLLPFMMLLFVLSFLDRVNVGFAALTMNADLGFTPEIYGFGAGIFFFGYFVFEVPSNLIMARAGARLWIFRIMLTWGLVSMAAAFVATPLQFYAVRFLLGVAEAGFFPGMILYLTYWFPAQRRARFFALFLIAVPLASAIGGPLSGIILEAAHGAKGLQGWQWLFLMEGAPSCLCAFAILWLLPDGPLKASWLSDDEKALIAARLAAEPQQQHQRLPPMLADPRVWFCALTYFGIVLSLYGINLWLPQIVKAMGWSNLETGFLVAIPYIASIVAMLLWSASSDRRGERTIHIAAAALTGAAGLLIAAYLGASLASVAALTLATAGTYAALGLFWNLPTTILGGTAAAGGIALINAIGNLGGFFGPSLIGYLKQHAGTYAAGMVALAAVLVATAGIVLVLGRVLPLHEHDSLSPLGGEG